MKKRLLVLLSSLFMIASCGTTNESIDIASNSTEEAQSTIDLSTEVEDSSLTSSGEESYRRDIKTVDAIVRKEQRASYQFFYDNISTKESGYGLIADRCNIVKGEKSNHNSIASTGYGLALYPVGVEYGWLDVEEGYTRTLRTLQTLDNIERIHGFYYHFLDDDGKRMNKDVEVSVIDTAILICGALIAGKYFGDQCESLANKIYEEIEWNWYYNENNQKYYMGYMPEKGFSGSWTGYAEQLMMYVLGAASPKYSVPKAAYNVMKASAVKSQATDYYDKFYMTYTGSLFVYQFSHAFIDFNRQDEAGVNWFNNSVEASKAAVRYADTMSTKYKTLSLNSWGLTASDGPNGYTGGYGSRPCSGGNTCDGTVAPCAAIGSIVFTPEDSIRAMNHFMSINGLWSKYGFIDAYNLGEVDGYDDPSINIQGNGWFDTDVIGIDKGISALMIENYISGMIWNISNEISYFKDGLKALGFN